ncbi:MAG: RlmE family RNA methyltransferase [Pseudobdellovibrionaceae bacterium]
MSYNPKDHYFQKAKKENFVARSVFKLDEIDTKFKIIQNKDWVLDLGASPGSWSQYCCKKIGPEGRLLGVDLQPMKVKMNNAVFIEADLNSLDLPVLFAEQGFHKQFDVVLSDMAPKTTGIRVTDQARSLELCELALNVAEKFLKPKGHFVCKFFHSDDFKLLQNKIKLQFQKVEALRPDSTRKNSKEIFLLGLNKK